MSLIYLLGFCLLGGLLTELALYMDKLHQKRGGRGRPWFVAMSGLMMILAIGVYALIPP